MERKLSRRMMGFSLGMVLLSAAAQAEPLRVMTFNLWMGGDGCKLGRRASIEAQTSAILKAKADVVGLEEQSESYQSRAEALARELGWNYYVVSSSRAVISRFPLEGAPVRTPQPPTQHRAAGSNSQAVYVTLPSGRRIIFGVVHLAAAPYQPYEIVDGNLKTVDEAQRSACQTRLQETQSVFGEVKPDMERGMPAIVVGDFNEPSCMDWTTAAVALRKNPTLPFAVDWPSARFLVEKGFIDTYRAVHPDPVAKPGYTWTSLPSKTRTEVLDRIDLIFASRSCGKIVSSQVVGEPAKDTDIQVEPWPSDHRAVLTEFEL